MPFQPMLLNICKSDMRYLVSVRLHPITVYRNVCLDERCFGVECHYFVSFTNIRLDNVFPLMLNTDCVVGCNCLLFLYHFLYLNLTHWGRDKMAAFSQTTLSNAFSNENIRISTKYSLKFVPYGLINNILALVLIMARRRPGDKPLSEPMLVSSLTHICVTRSQWVNMCLSFQHNLLMCT